MSKRTEHQIYPNSKPLRTSPNPAKPILAYHHTPLTRDTLYIEILRHGWVHVSRAVRRVRRVLCRARAVRGATWLARRAQILPALQPREEKTRKIYRLKPLGSNSDQAPMLNYVEKNMLN